MLDQSNSRCHLAQHLDRTQSRLRFLVLSFCRNRCKRRHFCLSGVQVGERGGYGDDQQVGLWRVGGGTAKPSNVLSSSGEAPSGAEVCRQHPACGSRPWRAHRLSGASESTSVEDGHLARLGMQGAVGLWIAKILTTSVINARRDGDGLHRPRCGGVKKAQAHPQQGVCLLKRLEPCVCLGSMLNVRWM